MGNFNYYNEDYLMHYGVKGMKWGVRRKSQAVVDAKANYKSAKKEYNKSYNKAYNYSARHPITQWTSKKNSAEAIRRWNDAADNAKKSQDAKKAYKQAKATDKAERKAERNTPEAQAARRKKAIKVGAAVAGTALAAYGAYKVSKTLKNKAADDSYKTGKSIADKYLKEAVSLKFAEDGISMVPKNPSDVNRSNLDKYHNVMRYTDARTKKVGSSTMEAYKYLRNKDGRADIAVGKDAFGTYARGHYGEIRRSR